MRTMPITALNRDGAGPGLELLIELSKDIPGPYLDVGGEGPYLLLLADCVARLSQQVRDLESFTGKRWGKH